MIYCIKLSCLLIYGLALAGWAGAWTGGAATACGLAALVLLAAHVVEGAVGFKYVRLYRGPLAVSMLLTLLFGILHLLPLARRAKRS